MKGTSANKEPLSFSEQIDEIHIALKRELPSHQHFYKLLDAIDGVILEPGNIPDRLMEHLPSDKSIELFNKLMEVRLKRHSTFISNLYFTRHTTNI